MGRRDRVAVEDAQARRPRAAGRRLRLRVHAALPERARSRVLRQVSRVHGDGGHSLDDAIRRTGHDARQRARPGEGRLSRRPAARRRRPAREPGYPARPEADPDGDEGRRVREGAGDRVAACVGEGGVSRNARILLWLIVGLPLAAFSVWALVDNARLFLVTLLNGLTLASLYFIVASGFTLVFGLMRNVNLAHGSLYLLGGYLGFFAAQFTGSWLLALAAGLAAAAGGGPAPPGSV